MGALPPFLTRETFDPHKNSNPIVQGGEELLYCPAGEILTREKPLPLKAIHARVSVCMANTNFASMSLEDCRKILKNVQILNEKFEKYNQKLQLKNPIWKWILSWFGIRPLSPLPTQALEVKHAAGAAQPSAAAVAEPPIGPSLVLQSALPGEREAPKPQYKVEVQIEKSTYTGDPNRPGVEKTLKEKLEEICRQTLGQPLKCGFRLSTSGIFVDDRRRDRPTAIWWHPIQRIFYIEADRKNPVKVNGENYPSGIIESCKAEFLEGANILEIEGYKFTLTLTKNG